MALTDTAIRNLKPEPKPYKKSDGEGLYLLVAPEGSRLWHLAYRFAGKQKTMALGPYPAVTLAMAREARVEAKRLLARGVDPSEKRKADRRAAAAARTFGEVADEWFDTKREPEGKSEATLERDRWLMGVWKSEIGRRPIGGEPPELLGALRKVDAREHYETASRMCTKRWLRLHCITRFFQPSTKVTAQAVEDPAHSDAADSQCSIVTGTTKNRPV
jgi:hypothetical protein